MIKEELYLKTVFCCMACDGDIADEEIAMVKELSSKEPVFKDIDVESVINVWITEINKNGVMFLQSYLKEIRAFELSEKEQLFIISLAIRIIEIDNRIEYSEIKFFKKIRSRLSISDEAILDKHPDKEDFLLPDINVADLPEWNNVIFDNIKLASKD